MLFCSDLERRLTIRMQRINTLLCIVLLLETIPKRFGSYSKLEQALTYTMLMYVRLRSFCSGDLLNGFSLQNEDAFIFAAKYQRHLVFLLGQLSTSNDDLPRYLRFDPAVRRLAMRALPYAILIIVALICASNIGLMYKGVLLFFVFAFTYGYAV